MPNDRVRRLKDRAGRGLVVVLVATAVLIVGVAIFLLW